MGLPISARDLVKMIEDHKERHTFNGYLFDMLEGDIHSYIEKTIKDQLSPRSANTAAKRIPPINLLKKVVNKLTRLYSMEPERTPTMEIDQELVAFYGEQMDIDVAMSRLNYNFNGYKYGAMKIIEKANGILSLRPMLPTQFYPISTSMEEPTKPNIIVEFAGMVGKHKKYWVYTDETFTAILENGTLYEEDMKDNEGVNPYGVMPFTYAAASDYLLIPQADYDMYAMPILIPLLMAEVNFGMQFLANPVVYGINLNLDNVHISPDTIINLKGDEMGSDKAQSLNVLQPSMDIPNQSKWISQDLLATWLESKDIRASVMTGTDSSASGINLMIREMDTTENVKRQAIIFKKAERDLWNRIAKMHNAIVEAGRLNAGKFSSDEINVSIVYAEQKPLEDRKSLVETAKSEVDAGLLSKKSAIARLNPSWSEKQIEEELSEIGVEKKPSFTFNESMQSEKVEINEGDV